MDFERHVQLSFDLIEWYSDVERELLRLVGRRFGKNYKSMMSGDIMDWQIRQMLELGELRREQVEILRKSARVSREKMVDMLINAGYSAADEHEETFQDAFRKGFVVLQPPKTDNSMRLLEVLNAYISQADDTLNLVNTSMLKAGQDAFLHSVNQIVAYVSTGIKTPQIAMRDALRDVGRRGLPVFRDKLGRQWSTESYLNMVSRTMASNIANEMSDIRRKEYGVNYIEVSAHVGARPRCEPYQGQIYYDGAGSDPLGRYPEFSGTSYGEAAGLFGVNCGHFRYPYIPGYSVQTFFPYNKSENDKAYQLSQRQRKLERDVRMIKRERAILTAAGDKEGAGVSQARLERKWQELRDFTKETGRTRNYQREQTLYTTMSDERKAQILKNASKL